MYPNKYLIEHCNNKFSFNNKLIAEQPLYHANSSMEYKDSDEYYLQNVINMMARHLGNDNRVADAIKPTPEMFRILVKLVDMQFRGVVDYGHMIPRGLVNKLTSEYKSLTGLDIYKLSDQ